MTKYLFMYFDQFLNLKNAGMIFYFLLMIDLTFVRIWKANDYIVHSAWANLSMMALILVRFLGLIQNFSNVKEQRMKSELYTLQFESFYLGSTSQFIEAIDIVLRLAADKQNTTLKKVLVTYGYVYPRWIVFGDHLYHTKRHRVKRSVEEHGKAVASESRFSISLTRAIKMEADVNNEKKAKEDLFEALGGDTLVGRDPILWAKSVVDHTL